MAQGIQFLRCSEVDGLRYKTPPAKPSHGANAREQTGGFSLLRIEKSEALSITALLQERNSDQIGRMELVVDSEDPPKIVKEELLPIPHPPDLAIPRLTESTAVAALSDFAQRAANNDRFSGVVLVAHNGTVLLEKGWGLAHRERGTPVTPGAQFNIASINKMFTAVAILQLVESGKLSFDDSIGKYIPDYANKDVASKVTICHLPIGIDWGGDLRSPTTNNGAEFNPS